MLIRGIIANFANRNNFTFNFYKIYQEMVTKLDELLTLVKSKEKKRLVAAYANDSHTIGAVSHAVDMGIIDATLVGDIDTIKKVCEAEKIDVNKFTLVQEADEQKAGNLAVKLINEGKGNLLM